MIQCEHVLSNTQLCYFKENEYTLFEDQLIIIYSGALLGLIELSISLKEQAEMFLINFTVSDSSSWLMLYSNKDLIRSLYSANKEKCLLVQASSTL